MKRRLNLGVIALLLVITTIFSACDKNAGAASSGQDAADTEVGFVLLKAEPMSLTQELAGRVKTSMQSDVRPQVSGIIQERLFTEGNYVKAGQVLYRIDADSYRAAFNQAEAALESAEVNLQAAKIKSERYTGLGRVNGISAQEIDDAVAAYKQAVAAVAERKAALETAQINLTRTEITAPISGFISISNFTPGALVTANQAEPLAVIRNIDPVYVDMTQSIEQVRRLKNLLSRNVLQDGNAEVTLIMGNNHEYSTKGILQLREVAVNETTGSVTLRAEFPNPNGELLPGMYVRAVVSEAIDNNAIMAPQQGIFWDVKGNAFAMVVTDNNTVEQRKVVLDQAYGDKWRVIRGLEQDDRLIVEGLNKVRNGQAVIPMELTREAQASIGEENAG